MPSRSKFEELFLGVYDGTLEVELAEDRRTFTFGLDDTFRELVGRVGDLL